MFKIENFLSEQFAFLYGGKPCSSYRAAVSREKTFESEDEDRYEIRFRYEFGVDAIREVRHFKKLSAISSSLTLENVSGKFTAQINGIKDFVYAFPLKRSTPRTMSMMLPDDNVKLYSYEGPVATHTEFLPAVRYLPEGCVCEFNNRTGRSADGTMPFFHFRRGDKGVAVAVGWTGNWRARFERREKDLLFESAVAGTDFYMCPGEKFRLSSVYLCFYDGEYADGQNGMRRLIKYLVAQKGHVTGEDLPFSCSAWGALSTQKMLETIDLVSEEKFGYNYYWIDAGWYGYSTQDCLNEYVGDWAEQTGNWVVNKHYHPDGLRDVAKKLKEKGMRLLLWVEPERMVTGTDLTLQHPDWFLKQGNDTWLLDLGNREAWDATLKLLSDLISELGIKCYRQDFNVDPDPFWKIADEPQRAGVKQIKHINGLYDLWDALLERFPDLIIDNCASGGRRLDIELLSRSVPLWRSDYYCAAQFDRTSIQNHTTGISALLPYHGTGFGNGNFDEDLYDWRSCYAPMMSQRFRMYADFGELPDGFKKRIRAFNEEYVSVRKYFSEDYYSLIDYSFDERTIYVEGGNTVSPDDSSWAAWQFNRREEGDGVVLAFRRERSPFESALFPMYGLMKNACYEFTDADTGEKLVLSGKKLSERGLPVKISSRRESKLFRYRKI